MAESHDPERFEPPEAARSDAEGGRVREPPPQASTKKLAPAGPDHIEVARITSAAKAALFGGRAQPIEIGRFTVLRTLGAGGMGRVYLAYDPQLDRRVALKLVSPTVGGDARKRLLREAKALARVTHPNIVHVYEVGTHEDEVYLAMEYVRGKTLTPWRRERERSTSEIVAVFAAAARGLEAAHAARLVHRDVKPSNIIVGDDGRVRVVDFGLARRRGSSSVDAMSSPSFEPSSGGFNVTRTGQVTGTPAYMSPEQFTGENIGPASDQFSLCVALYEAIFDERPFQRSEGPKLAAAVLAGKRDPVPNANCPRRIRAVLERGMSVDPADRFESMAQLRKALEPPQRRRAFAIVGTALVAATATWAVVKSPEAAAKPCTTDSSTHLWTDETRAAVRAVQQNPEEPGQWEAEERYLGQYAAQLVSLHEGACDAHAEAKPDDRVTTWQRLACYEARAVEFKSLLDALADPEVGRVGSAAELAGELDDCSDVAMLRELVAHADGEARPRTQTPELLSLEVRAAALWSSGKLEEAEDEAKKLVERARELEVPSSEARGLLLQARGEIRRGRLEEARELHERIADLAARSGDDRSLARVWVAMLRFLSVDMGQPKEAQILLPVARAAVARAGGGPRLRSLLAQRSGDLAYRNGDLKGAVEQYQQAIEIAESQPIVDQRKVLGLKANIAGLVDDMGDYAQGIAAAEEVLDAAMRYGIDDAEIVANTYFMVHTSYQRLRRFDEAQWALDMADEVFEERYGPGHDIDRALIDAQAQLDLERGNFVAALERAQEALNVGLMVHEADHPDLAITWNTLGLIHDRLGDDATAAKAYQNAMEIWRERMGPKHPRTLVALGNWAGSLFDSGDIEGAKAAWEQSLRIAEEIDGPTAPSVAYPLIGLAKIDIEAGRTELAVERLERGISLAQTGSRDAVVADAEQALAEALVRGDGSRARARELARSAERFFAANAKTFPTELAGIRSFITANSL